jgi:hypothetical protein
MEAHPGRRSANDITDDNRVNPEIRDPTTFLSRSGSAPGSGPVRGFFGLRAGGWTPSERISR